jgi:D-arabinose 1-dehydrogenase-like Zn-dependent alcohol dehydrogenase
MHVRKVAVLSLSISLALSLSACATGKDAPTKLVTQVTDGVDGSITTYGNDLKVSSVLLVAQSDGSAVLVGTITNENPTADTLLGITVGGIKANLSQVSLALKQNEPVRFAGDSANASAIVPGLNAAPGTRVKVQLSFASAGELTLDAIVLERSGVYANVGA